jgi:hypothetical protein
MPAPPPRGIPCAPTLAALGQSTRLFKLLLRGNGGLSAGALVEQIGCAQNTYSLTSAWPRSRAGATGASSSVSITQTSKVRAHRLPDDGLVQWASRAAWLCKGRAAGALMLASNYEASQVSRSHATISGPAEEFASQDIACGPSSQFHLQHAGAQHASTVLLLVGFTARTKALMNLPSTCGARASTSTPFPDRNSLASSIA